MGTCATEAMWDAVLGGRVQQYRGGCGGLLLGVVMFLMPPGGVTLQLVTVLIITVIAALVGAWIASLVGTSVPNSRLKMFQDDIAHGKILLIVDVPARRAEWLREMILKNHPEVSASTMESSTFAFP